ncbi:MAG: hypothetical protein RJB26_1298 [Pseudomonadota bacterium]
MEARRLAYLEAMGLEVLALRAPQEPAPAPMPKPESAPIAMERPPVEALPWEDAKEAADRHSRESSRPVAAPSEARASSGAQSRPVSRPAVPLPAAPTVAAAPALRLPHPAGSLAWEPLEAAVGGCRRCGLCGGRTQPVFGAGARRARWMIIGEAPGLEEDRDGNPCAGKAGEMLTAMLKACGVQREDVFITNVLKCRPPDNREPEPAEVAECLPYLLNQLALVQPELVVCLGRAPAQHLLGTDLPLAKLRGQVHRLQVPPVPVVVTYHPTYLLRAPQDKRKAWEDLQFAMAQVPPAAPPAGG